MKFKITPYVCSRCILSILLWTIQPCLLLFFYFSLLVNWEISLWWYMLDFPNRLNFKNTDTQSCLWNSKYTSVHLWWGWWVSDASPEGSYRMHLKTQKQTGSLPASLYNTEMFPAVAGSWSTLQDTWGAAISFLATQCAWKGDLRVNWNNYYISIQTKR